MQCNLLHNKIIKDTVSSAFIDGIQNDLLPRIESLYGDELKGVLMYEDHLADGFSYEGEWYYPLTLMTCRGDEIFWIKWSVEKTKNFRNGNPYSYVGKEPLEFYVADEVPEQFKSAMEGRAINYDRDSLPIQIYANDADPSLLVGKYSQSFVDEMARQLTDEISSAMSVVGLPESNMEFQLVFTPETYMQHTSENVTYRRLLITDYGCQARDFWVKWTRLDGVVGYSISDHVTAENIKFELGEDVPQKVREKEYRFLCRVNPDKYQSSMGKKTVTEWRELIKRAVKRGDLTKIISDVEIADRASDLSDKLREVLSNHGVAVSGAPVVEQNDGFNEKIADMARAVTEEKETYAEEYEEELQLSEEPSEEECEILAEEAALDADADDGASNVADESAEDELCEETVEEENEAEEPVIETEAEDKGDFIFTPGFQPFEEIELEDAQTAEESVLENERFTLPEIELTDAAEPVAEDISAVEEREEVLETPILEADEDEKDEDAEIEVEIEILEEAVEEEAEAEAEEAEAEAEEAEAEAEAEAAEAEAEEVCELKDDSEEIKQLRDDFAKAEMEALARIEYEIAAREKAEKEAMLLRLESERLKAENERLIAEAKKLEEERLLAERKREEEERAKAEAEAQRIREEAEYRARVEEQARRDAEERARLAEAARIAVEEQRRIEAERREREIKEREEREERDRERILREEEERRAEARRLEEERRAFEEEQKKAQEAPPVQYMTKHARLIFGRNVDLNVIKRIKEIVEETLVACRKEHVHIHIKAYPIDSYTIHLDVAKIPVTESDLLVSIIKAIGNGRIGVTKIFLE